MGVTIGVPGTIMPPVEGILRTARRNEEKGFDSIWWPDHLMGWYPQSIWTPDIAEVARYQANPHVYVDPFVAMGAVAVQTERIRMGTSVTDLLRRHPASLAQTALTVQHLSKGRFILGVGAGEGENLEPYGIAWDRPAARMEEALQVIRMLWEAEGPVSFEGRFYQLKDAVLGLGPYEGHFPELWLAAHGPRTLDMVGQYADGWLPVKLPVEDYARGLERIRASAKRHGRDPDAITPSLWCYTIVAEDHDTVLKLMEHPLLRSLALIRSPEMFERRGLEHPLGKGFNALRDLIPSRMGREETLAAIAKIPPDMVGDFVLHGTPQEIAEEIRRYAAVGLRHWVLWNVTFLGDLSRVRSSFEALEEIQRLVA